MTAQQILIRFDIGTQQWIRSDQPHSPGWADRTFRALVARDFPQVTVYSDRTYRITVTGGKPTALVMLPA
jgi:hypothetical protein